MVCFMVCVFKYYDCFVFDLIEFEISVCDVWLELLCLFMSMVLIDRLV